MLTISITFAILVALWGFSGTLVSFARRSFATAKSRREPQPRRVARPQPAAASRTRGTRPVASA